MRRTTRQLVFDLLDEEGDLAPAVIAARLDIPLGNAHGNKHRWKKERGFAVGTRQKPMMGLQRIPTGGAPVPQPSFRKPVGENIRRSKPMRNQAKLKERGIKELYYYIRFGEGAEKVADGFLGVATVCLIHIDGVFARGIAFCNPLDLWRFNKKLGRNIALGRAIKAAEKNYSSEIVPSRTPAGILRTRSMDFLSTFSPLLTSSEQKLVELAKKLGWWEIK